MYSLSVNTPGYSQVLCYISGVLYANKKWENDNFALSHYFRSSVYYKTAKAAS